jgi:hypothetical protein
VADQGGIDHADLIRRKAVESGAPPFGVGEDGPKAGENSIGGERGERKEEGDAEQAADIHGNNQAWEAPFVQRW